MSCEGDFCSVDKLKPGSKRHSSSGSKRGKYENPDSKPSGSQKGKISIENFMSLYIFVKQLGNGAFGVVNLMKHAKSDKNYAVKVIKKTDPHTDTKTRNEINLSINLDSEYVCKVHSYHEDDENFYIFMEYLTGMDLCEFIRKYRTFFINNPKCFWFVVKSILQGLVYLHSQGIAHFDIKPENVFLLLDTAENIIGVKLIDLGLAVKINENERKFRGTASYMAPEFFHLCWSTEFKADIWSLGMTAYAMLMASLPISSRKKDHQLAQQEIYHKIEKLLSFTKITPFPKRSDCKEIFQIEEFIALCFIVDPSERPTAQQLLDFILAIKLSNT